MTDMKAEIVIVGAGVIGSGLAMGLAELGAGRDVLVVDPDLEGTFSSSELNAGGVRATFNQPANVEASKISIEYFTQNAQEVGYRACGYLWMHGPERFERALKEREKWLAQGWEVEAWTPAELQSRRPFIDQVADLGGALFAPRDGLLNPNLLKSHFREKAKAGGVRFADRLRVRGAGVGETGVSLDCERLPSVLSREEKETIFTSAATDEVRADVTRERVQAGIVVNCAGPWAAEIAGILGYESPSFPVRRQICVFDCREVDLSPYGMMIDSSGVYFHPEATNIMGGIAVRDEPRGKNFAYDGEDFFQEKIWMALAERSSKFASLKHLTGWGGLYEVSPDESAIIGEAHGTKPGRVFEAHSFSGHGVMHSYAVGRALAERIVHGECRTMDLAPFACGRFLTGRTISETAVI